jgi:phosphoglycerate dehydrogenase-like enzyme
VLRANPQLLCLARCGAGVDNIDVAEATARGLPVLYAPGASTQSVAEHALMLMLAAARQACRWDREVKARRWKARETARGVELAGKTLGIVGMGRIGRRVAELGAALGMEVSYWSRSSRDERFHRVELDALLRSADVVSLHVALADETGGLLGAQQFASMKPGALLINTARGALLDEEALYRALTEGPLGGAALDVLTAEPPPDDHPLLALDNVVFSPHIAGITDVAYRAACVRTVIQVIRVLQGQAPDPAHVCNADALHRARAL